MHENLRLVPVERKNDDDITKYKLLYIVVWTWTASGPRAVRRVLLLNLQRFTLGFTSSAGGDVAAVVKPTHRNA